MTVETVQNLGVVGLGQRQAGAGENAMRWRVVIELTRRRWRRPRPHEVATGSDESAGSVVKPLGLTLADAKALPGSHAAPPRPGRSGGLLIVKAPLLSALPRGNAR